MRWVKRTWGLGALAALISTACVEPFDGSKVQLLLGGGVHVPGEGDPGDGRPPADTHYSIFVLRDDAFFKMIDFDIKRVIDRADPCFIEDDESRFPGLHTTMWGLKTIEAAQDASSEGGEPVTDQEAGDIAVAEIRVANLPRLEDAVRAVVKHQDGLVEATLEARHAAIVAAAPIDDMSASANATRREMCRALYAEFPAYYVGSDKVFTLPINGVLYGMVDGSDPRNAAFLGGSSFNVNATFPAFDSLVVNWDYNDPALAGADDTDVGYHYMAGRPEYRTRGVVNVPLQNNDYGPIQGEAAIFTDLDGDDVQF
jgi:hypothetical protein